MNGLKVGGRLVRRTLVALAIAIVLPVAGCSRCVKKQGPRNLAVAESPAITPPDPDPQRPPICPIPPAFNPPTVYFDYDQATPRPDQVKTLEEVLQWVKYFAEERTAFVNNLLQPADRPDYEKWRVLVEGHCDEQGSTEYNFALGERRARAVADYLIAGGFPAERLKVVSRGEERPVNPAHTEEAWKSNRRVECVYIYQD